MLNHFEFEGGDVYASLSHWGLFYVGKRGDNPFWKVKDAKSV